MIYRSVFGLPRASVTNPFRQFENLRQQMDRLSEAFDQGFSENSTAGVFPLINVSEDRDNYYVNAELPGVKSDTLDIQANAKSISISGERKIETEGNNVKYHRKEREAGKFSRMISLQGEIDPEKIDAKLSNGVLKIAIPKAEAIKPRQITVK